MPGTMGITSPESFQSSHHAGKGVTVMNQEPDLKEQRRKAMRNLSYYILAAFILLVVLYPQAFR
jgi:hypothetical protein